MDGAAYIVNGKCVALRNKAGLLIFEDTIKEMVGDMPELSEAEIQAEIESMIIKPEDLRCYTCEDRNECEFAGDPYNTDGDCLACK